GTRSATRRMCYHPSPRARHKSGPDYQSQVPCTAIPIRSVRFRDGLVQEAVEAARASPWTLRNSWRLTIRAESRLPPEVALGLGVRGAAAFRRPHLHWPAGEALRHGPAPGVGIAAREVAYPARSCFISRMPPTT